MIFRAVVYSS